MPTISCNFPNNENPLTNGGAGAGSFTNNVSTTWNHPVTASSAGYAQGLGSLNTNDAIAQATGSWASTQTVTGTVHLTSSGSAGEVELHKRMTQLLSPDRVFTYEDDYTETVFNIVLWGAVDGSQGDFVVFGGATISNLLDGDVIKGTISGASTNASSSGFVNNVLQAGAVDTRGKVPVTGKPGIGFDENGAGGAINFKGYTATDGTSAASNLPIFIYGDLSGIGSPGRFFRDRL